MNEYLVVDGYNIIYAWPHLDNLKKESLEHARDKLIAMLVNYAAHSGEIVYVIFDAHQVKGGVERLEERSGIKIVYTKYGETADSVIEKMVGELTPLGRVYVATSDYNEQKIIFGRGAYRLTPNDLKKRMEQYRAREKKWARTKLTGDTYLENRLADSMRKVFEEWRRSKK